MVVKVISEHKSVSMLEFLSRNWSQGLDFLSKLMPYFNLTTEAVHINVVREYTLVYLT